MYESLTKYLIEFTGDEFGTWVIDGMKDARTGDRTGVTFVTWMQDNSSYSQEDICVTKIKPATKSQKRPPEGDLKESSPPKQRADVSWKSSSYYTKFRITFRTHV